VNSNLPAVTSTTKEPYVCDRCKSIGFEPSLEEGKCTFCDGTFGGQSTKISPRMSYSAQLEAAGHVLKRDPEDGRIDIWVLDADFHNGPGCINCDMSWCQHCRPSIKPCLGREATDAKYKSARYQQYLELKKEFEQ
jgi:hypothetical protein